MPSPSALTSSTSPAMAWSKVDGSSYFPQVQHLRDRDDRSNRYETSSFPWPGISGGGGSDHEGSPKPSPRILKRLANRSSKASSPRSSEDGLDDLSNGEEGVGATGSLSRRARKLFSIPEPASKQARRWNNFLSRKPMNRKRHASEISSRPTASELIRRQRLGRERCLSDTIMPEHRSDRIDSVRSWPHPGSQPQQSRNAQRFQIIPEVPLNPGPKAPEYPRASLLTRSHRRWKHYRKSSSPDGSDLFSPHGETSATHQILVRVSGILHQLKLDADGHHQSSTNKSKSPVSSTESNTSRRWHLSTLRKAATNLSTSSSVLRLVMGKPPVNTPDTESMYRGADDIEYFKVDIADPKGPTYLPSEARRIGTPPLPSEGPRSSRARGFFFDYAGPPEDPDSPPPLTQKVKATAPSSRALPNGLSSSETYSADRWFRSKEFQREESFALKVSSWTWEVPAHLPDSLLCPLHEKSVSKAARGICTYHGRNKTLL